MLSIKAACWHSKDLMNPDNRQLLFPLHLMFFLSGIGTVLIGQVLPNLAGSFALTDLEAGYFFPAQFSGSMLGTLATSWFGRKRKFLNATILGCVAIAAGLTAMNLTSFGGSLSGFFITGLGIGLTLPSINMLVLEMSPQKGASALSVLNFCWGLGAIVCKPYVDLTSTKGSIFVTTLFLAIPLLAGAAFLAAMPRLPEQPQEKAVPAVPNPSSKLIWTTGLAWVIALFNFIQVGFEGGIGGWLTTYADRLEGVPVAHLLSPTFIYYLFFVLGRGAAPLFFRWMNEDRVLFFDLALMLIGMIVILSAGDLLWLSIGAAFSGFGASSVFPTNLSRFTSIFGSMATRRATPLFICGTLGAASVTWLIGFVSDKAGNLRAGMFIMLGCVIVLLAVQALLSMAGQAAGNAELNN